MYDVANIHILPKAKCLVSLILRSVNTCCFVGLVVTLAHKKSRETFQMHSAEQIRCKFDDYGIILWFLLLIVSAHQKCLNKGFPTQNMKMVRLEISDEELLYYTCRENKGTDQLQSYCAADLCLCFCIHVLAKSPFSNRGSVKKYNDHRIHTLSALII